MLFHLVRVLAEATVRAGAQFQYQIDALGRDVRLRRYLQRALPVDYLRAGRAKTEKRQVS